MLGGWAKGQRQKPVSFEEQRNLWLEGVGTGDGSQARPQGTGGRCYLLKVSL